MQTHCLILKPNISHFYSILKTFDVNEAFLPVHIDLSHDKQSGIVIFGTKVSGYRVNKKEETNTLFALLFVYIILSAKSHGMDLNS